MMKSTCFISYDKIVIVCDDIQCPIGTLIGIKTLNISFVYSGCIKSRSRMNANSCKLWQPNYLNIQTGLVSVGHRFADLCLLERVLNRNQQKEFQFVRKI